jgi:CRISPR-associated protein Csb2
VKYRLYVPDNSGDKVAASWSRGRDASLADYRTEKDVRPTKLPHDAEAVHYLWRLCPPDPEFEQHREELLAAARSITHVGWGVDMVTTHALVLSEADADGLPGERWLPSEDGSATGRRIPLPGTLDALIARHEAFLGRIGPEGLRPVPPLARFGVVGYRRAMDPPGRDYAAFSLLKPDASGFRPFDTARNGIAVAAMMRHAAGAEVVARALGWPTEKVAGFILGHGEAHGEAHAPVGGPRLAFVPIPSIEARDQGRAHVVGAVRRALLVVLGGRATEDLQQLARLLSGAELTGEDRDSPAAILSRIPKTDPMIQRYTRPATTWATVTPVILPGHDDPRKLRRRLGDWSGPDSQPHSAEGLDRKELIAKLDRRIDYLLRKAIRQAGYSEELARCAAIEWRGVGFRPGTDHATRYVVPSKLRRFRRLHIQITWRDPSGRPITIPGPLCFGGGRFHGLGLFVGSDRTF